MRPRVAFFDGRPVGRLILVSVAALLASACSSDTLRFNENPFSNPFASSRVDTAPTGSITPGSTPPGAVPGPGSVATAPLPPPSVPLGGPSAPAAAPKAVATMKPLPAARPAAPPKAAAIKPPARVGEAPKAAPAKPDTRGIDRSLAKVEPKRSAKTLAEEKAARKPPAPAKESKKVAALVKPSVKADDEDDDDIKARPAPKKLAALPAKPGPADASALKPKAPPAARAKDDELPTDRAAAPVEPENPPTGAIRKPDAPGGKFRWPARGRVITAFGSGGNEGINIAVPEGTPVRAAEDGVVAYAGDELKRYGKLVLVRHNDGWVTAYAHNGEINVKKGDKVTRGQQVAKAGQTGNVASPQVHFELRKGATPVDPSKHLEAN